MGEKYRLQGGEAEAGDRGDKEKITQEKTGGMESGEPLSMNEFKNEEGKMP